MWVVSWFGSATADENNSAPKEEQPQEKSRMAHRSEVDYYGMDCREINGTEVKRLEREAIEKYKKVEDLLYVVGNGPEPLNGRLYEVIDVPGNGNCFFHAVAHQLKVRFGISEFGYIQLRKFAYEQAFNADRDFISAFMVNDDGDSRGGPQTIEGIAMMGTWAGEATVLALANFLGVTITIVQGTGDQGVLIRRLTPLFESLDLQISSLFPPGSEIVLRYVDGNHYQSLV